MRVRGRLLAPLAVAILILVAPALVRASTSEQLAAYAVDEYGMTCDPTEGDITCTRQDRIAVWRMVIKPASGQEDSLQTVSQTGSPLDGGSRFWMADMHLMACGSGDVRGFVDKVGDLVGPGTVGPETIGTCTFTGGFTGPGTNVQAYHVESVFNPPATAKPTPRKTPRPTPRPTPRHTPRPSPTAAPSEPPTGESPSPEPSASPLAPPTPLTPPSFQPTQEVAAATEVAAPSAQPPAAPPPVRPPPVSFAASIVSVTGVNEDATAIGGSLALALLLLLLVGFAGELWNNTVENNYETIAGWFRRVPLVRLSGWLTLPGPFGVLLFLALTALVSSFVDPTFGPDLRGLAEFLGFLVGLVIVLASFKLPPMLARRRKTGELGRLRPLPWALVIAALFVLVSRIGNLQPGYLYGIVLGAIFVSEVSDREEGRETLYGSLWTLGAAVLAWLALTWLRSTGAPQDGFGFTVLSTAFAATLVAGLEATAFGLMPVRFMPGHALYRWNRLAWALLFGISVFAFIHILIGPSSGYVSQLSPAAFLAALGVFAAFGALSIGTWAYFRFRRPAEAA